MSIQTQAIGTLLIEISDLAGSAEQQGIVGNPSHDVLWPLIEQAQQLGVDVAPQATLADLHLAVDLAAQVIAEQALEADRFTTTPRTEKSLPKAESAFAQPSPQVGLQSQNTPARTEQNPDGET